MSSVGTIMTSDVIVIGGGAAGLTAAYHLEQMDWTVTLLEASTTSIGGRLRKDSTTFAPELSVDLGGEWIHGTPNTILNPILDRNVAAEVNTIKHTVSTYNVWDGTEFYEEDNLSGYENNHKWVNSTWWDFFNNKVASELSNDTIKLGCVVTEIDYSSSDDGEDGCNGIIVKCANGDTYIATDAVVVTVSMTLLQQGSITFNPPLPDNYQEAINDFQMSPGLKVFIEFEGNDKFFPEIWEIESDWSDFSENDNNPNYSERTFYDATWGQKTDKNVIGMFCFGAVAARYLSDANNNPDAVLQLVLAELDLMFDGKATDNILRSVVQIWSNNEPYVQTGYTRYVTDDTDVYAIDVLRKPINNKLYFAGEAIPVDNSYSWGFAHGAAMSGKVAAQKIDGTYSGDGSGGSGNNTSSGSYSGLMAVLATILPCLF